MKVFLGLAATRLLTVAVSTKFFIAILAALVVQAVWLAFSAYYPLPFDEYVHVGNIQIYAQQWSPFIAEQPAYASIYGDITREASYLYYYLMSFPYRFFELFTDNEMILIIATRLINIAFVVGGLILFRKLLMAWGLPKRVTRIALLAFVMTPIIPFLAAHVNYDNLMFLLAPLFLLTATRLITDNQDFVRRLMLFALLGMSTVLVKRTFLLLAGIVAVYVAVAIWRRNGAKLLKILRDSWHKTRKGWVFVCLSLLLLTVTGLFAERYGGNVLNYGSIWPKCHEVQSREVCAEFGPWHRDYVAIAWLRPSEPPFGNPASFTQYWLDRMIDGYYVLFSHAADAPPRPGDPFGGVQGKGMLPLPLSVGYVALVVGLAAVVWQSKRIWRNRYLRFGIIISAGYLVALWAFNYKSYLDRGMAQAIQARYTYPILIIIFALMIQAGSWSLDNLKLKKPKITQIKAVVLLLFIFTYVWGGGIAGWIIHSRGSWRWQNSVVQTVNHSAANVLRYLVIN